LLVTQTTNGGVRLEPELSQWDSLASAAKGDIFGKNVKAWRSECRKSLGLPEHKKIIVVGHQPEFFHPGILAKFIAGDLVAQKLNGVLVHLVVDHHTGSCNTIEIPERHGGQLVAKDTQLATLDHDIAMKDQKRVTPSHDVEPFTSALIKAKGDNAAIQFASATDTLMSPWVKVDHLIGSSELLQTEFGMQLIKEMYRNPNRCRETYNHAVSSHPDCGIALLSKDEFPVWYGNRNERFGTPTDSVQPRALVLTLLARVVLGDLFIHGTGGMSYDKMMEQWVSSWLEVAPCPATMATATLHLPLHQQTIDDARKQYFSPGGESQTRDQFLSSIDRAPYKSSTKSAQFQAMHDWLASLNSRPDETQFRVSQRIASRRDWAFPLYPVEMLDQLRDAIKEY
jgi:hypothetical protein